MIRKSVITGTVTGLLLTLLTIFPIFVVLVGRAVPAVGCPAEDWLGEILMPGVARISVSLIVLMGLSGLAMLMLLSIGTIAALRSGANSWRTGL